jgi:hypothetical protein
MKKILLFFMIFVLAGCSYSRIAKRNNQLMLTLNPGQTKQEVLKIMGGPSRNERYSLDKKQIDVWYYRTDSFLTGSWDDDEYFTPMVFEDGILVGWGKDYYDEDQRHGNQGSVG